MQDRQARIRHTGKHAARGRRVTFALIALIVVANVVLMALAFG